VQILANNGTATGIVVSVELLFFDNLGDAIPINHVRMDLPGGVATTINTSGQGPMRGQYLMILLTNQIATFTASVTFSLTGTQRIYTSDDWRSDGGLTNQAGVNSATPWTNELCIVNGVSIASDSTQTFPIFFYSGNAYLHVDNASGAGTIQEQVITWDPTGRIITFDHPAENNGVDLTILMPRVACFVQISNSGAAAATVNFALIADRV
jgi:hypothetical protein